MAWDYRELYRRAEKRKDSVVNWVRLLELGRARWPDSGGVSS